MLLDIMKSGNRIAHIIKTVSVTFWLCLLGLTAQAQEQEPLAAFENFVVSGDLKSAHFYLENQLLKPELIETSRLFVEAVIQSNMKGTRSNAPFSVSRLPSVELLYNYLGAIRPIDLNGVQRCNYYSGRLRNDHVCSLATFLFSIGATPQMFEFFQSRGMTTTSFSKDTLPPVVVFVSDLGVAYGMNELTWFSQNGLPLGPETYSRVQLTAWDGLVSKHRFTRLPDDKPETSEFNFIDLLTLSIANTGYHGRELNNHRDFLCRYITHVAAQLPPTFDHFSYLLKNVKEFRGSMIGKSSHPQQWGIVDRAVFPHSCRVLIEAMGRSSLQLDTMISEFSAVSDLKTAQWLVSLKQSKGGSNAQSN
ncbi:hypothetical protein [Roseibium polysiphoniae]|uniref:Uncharacterized protein n=1 Tax=Roseibium polysiphoniae TaxID=2571221 RepID=A0ABR9CE73_9HYPH|nr:hypothetical protein [Roseibium polysiphoniae]MBD8877943.1 hypothetical protein [Roseibium polysiphoniae]